MMVRASATNPRGEIDERASGAGNPTVTVVPPGAVAATAVSKARAFPAASTTMSARTPLSDSPDGVKTSVAPSSRAWANQLLENVRPTPGASRNVIRVVVQYERSVTRGNDFPRRLGRLSGTQTSHFRCITATCAYSASKIMTCRIAFPSASSSMPELMSASSIREEMSFSTGSFPSRHNCA